MFLVKSAKLVAKLLIHAGRYVHDWEKILSIITSTLADNRSYSSIAWNMVSRYISRGFLIFFCLLIYQTSSLMDFLRKNEN